MSALNWLTTTTKGRLPTSVTRAKEVAKRVGIPYVERNDSIPRLLRRHGAAGAYVVGPEKAELRKEGLKLSVHPSTLHHVRDQGRDHPLLRSICPPGEEVEHVIDATLGLAKDAIHVATFLQCRVTGIEVQPLLACLCEDGLARLEEPWSEGAQRIEVLQADSHAFLASLPTSSVDAVLLDPMFESGRRAAPGFDLLRQNADHRPLDEAWLAEAQRVACKRLVLKLPPGVDPPGKYWTAIRGSSLAYYTLSCVQ